MASPLNATGLAGLWVPDDLTAPVENELIASFPSTAPAFPTDSTLVQATDADKPQMRTTGVGGKRALKYDGVSDCLRVSPTPYMNAVGGATLYGVFTIPAVPAESKHIIGLTTDQTGTLLNGFQIYIVSTGAARLGGRRVSADAFTSITSARTNLCDGTPHVICGVGNFQTGAMELYVDGTLEASGTFASTGTTAAANAHRLSLGVITVAATNFFPDQIAMTGLYHAAHDAPNRAEVHSWVQDHYGILVSDYVSSVALSTYRPTSTLAAGGWTTTAPSLHGALSDESLTTIITGTGV